MPRNKYLLSVVRENQMPPMAFLNASLILRNLDPVISSWAEGYLKGISLSGSYAKGTAIKGSTDVDLFISLNHNSPGAMKEIFHSLYEYMRAQGWDARIQNVSIGLSFKNFSVDLIPARKQPGLSIDHTLFHRKTGTWKMTNVAKHIRIVKNSGRTTEIKALKVWRQRHGLDFPSFYLELVVLKALRRRFLSSHADNFDAIMRYLANEFVRARIEDPANSNNIVSDDLTPSEKKTISHKAESCLGMPLNQVIW